MRFTFLIVLTIFLFALQTAAQKNPLIGYKHRGVIYGETLPNGFKDLGGGLLSDENYGVTRYLKGKKHFLWLEKITGRDREGVPSWVVLDVLAFSGVKKNQEFLFSYSSSCTTSGEENLDTIVFAELKPKAKRYRILKAWKANTVIEKFERISVKGIKCIADNT